MLDDMRNTNRFELIPKEVFGEIILYTTSLHDLNNFSLVNTTAYENFTELKHMCRNIQKHYHKLCYDFLKLKFANETLNRTFQDWIQDWIQKKKQECIPDTGAFMCTIL